MDDGQTVAENHGRGAGAALIDTTDTSTTEPSHRWESHQILSVVMRKAKSRHC